MTEAPEGTLIRMQDGSVRVKRAGQWAPVNPAFAAPTRATPDAMAARQEYGKGVAAIAADRKTYNGYGALPTQIERFNELNTGQATGSLWNQVFKDRTLFGEQDPELGAMNSISSSIQTHTVPQGQGSASNLERDLFAAGAPRVENVGPVNQQIITGMKGAYQAEGDRLAFADAYLAANGTLNGSSEAWTKYVQDNPYTVTAGTSIRPNAKRAPWRQYFGLEAAPAAPVQRDAKREAWQKWQEAWVARRGNDVGAGTAFGKWWPSEAKKLGIASGSAAPTAGAPRTRPAAPAGGGARIVGFTPKGG